MNEINVLQIGRYNWKDTYEFPQEVVLDYQELYMEPSVKMYDAVFVERTLSKEEIARLMPVTKAYTLFIMERAGMTPQMEYFIQCRCGTVMKYDDLQHFLQNDIFMYFSAPYGEKYNPKNIAVTNNFAGDVSWRGNCSVLLDGVYGNDYSQVIYWRNNIPINEGQSIDMWLEYEKDASVSVMMKVVFIDAMSADNVVKTEQFDDEALKNVVTVCSEDMNTLIFVSLFAKGSGKLTVTALHDRYSRRDKGFFLVGGDRYVTSDNEELFCYFDPGDMKPPLNIYFSGYKTMEGFEGYNMMRKLGCPFLLIAEARLEGGAFYTGSAEYEDMARSCINRYISKLGFKSDEVIMSGLSMGTTGAMYYGCDIKPHAVIIGKPLISVGNIALNEKRLRPGGFPTSLDLLTFVFGESSVSAAEKFNAKMWDRFGKTDWGHTKFIATYMLEDDYDSDAYEKIISHLHSAGVQIYGKGIHGRHNDNTGAIVNWFVGQYEKVLQEDFAREVKR